MLPSAGAEDRATLESDPSAAAGDGVSEVGPQDPASPLVPQLHRPECDKLNQSLRHDLLESERNSTCLVLRWRYKRRDLDAFPFSRPRFVRIDHLLAQRCCIHAVRLLQQSTDWTWQHELKTI